MIFWKRYNSHSEFDYLDFNLGNKKNIVIIANGTVAVDVAIILTKNIELLRSAYISDKAIK